MRGSKDSNASNKIGKDQFSLEKASSFTSKIDIKNVAKDNLTSVETATREKAKPEGIERK